MVEASAFKGHEGDPVALIASRIPFIGAVAGPLTALIGGIVVYISANSGGVSVSRLTYSMSQFQLIPSWFNQVHARYKTPARTIVVFSGAALLITVLPSSFRENPEVMPLSTSWLICMPSARPLDTCWCLPRSS